MYIHTHYIHILYTHRNIQPYITWPYLISALHYIALPYHYITLQHYITLHDATWHTRLRHCVTLHSISLPHLTLHYITVHSTTVPRFFSYVPQLFHNSSTTVPIWTVDYIHLTFHTPKFLLPGRRQLRQLLRWLRGWRWWRRSHGWWSVPLLVEFFFGGFHRVLTIKIWDYWRDFNGFHKGLTIKICGHKWG